MNIKPYVVHCPHCGSKNVVEAEIWFAKTVEDPDVTAELIEFQCLECYNRSFWV